MKIAIIAVQLSLICASFSAQPAPTPNEDAPVYVPGGFGKGQDYLKMSASQKRAYAMGAVNGMLVASLFDAPEKSTNWLTDYLKGVTDVQLAATITKYLNDNPELWNLGLHVLSYNAIREAYSKTYHPDGR